MTISHSLNSTTSPSALATLPPESTASAPVASGGSMLDAALEYAAQGFEVFPLNYPTATGEHAACSCGKSNCGKSIGKHPLAALAPRGSTDATTNPATIRAWWGAYPLANIGMTLEGFVVVDVDPRHGGDESIRRFQREHPLPSTRLIMTGSGGAHFIFRGTPGKAYQDILSAGFPGVDIKAGGGAYLVAAPSLHASGGRYQVFQANEIAPLPEVLEMILSKAANSTEPSPVWRVPMPDNVARERIPQIVDVLRDYYVEGCMHNIAFSLGGFLRKEGWTQDQVEELARALPSNNPEKAVAAALDGTLLGENGPGYKMLSQYVPEPALNELSRLRENPAQAAALAPVTALIERAQAPAASSTPALIAAPVSAWTELGISEICAPLPPVPWVVEDLGLAPGAPLITAGFGFTGKTVALQSLAVSVAAGKLVWGKFAARQGRVLHVDYEQGSRLTRDRYQRLMIGMGVTAEHVADRLKVVSMPSLYLSDTRTEDFLSRRCDGVALAIIDSLHASCPTIEENSAAARAPLDTLGRISERTGCAFIVIHHARKPTKDSAGGAKMSMRGSGALFDACASVLILAAEKDEPTTVVHEKNRITGVTLPDFALRIEDTHELNRPAGLAVRHVEAEAEATAQKNVKLEGNCQKIRAAFLSLKPGEFFQGREAIRALAGIGKEPFLVAFSTLIGRNEIFVEGTGPRTQIKLCPS
jgi:Bifunctional DNA primase/polymerase, N-terminal/AAA domain